MTYIHEDIEKLPHTLIVAHQQEPAQGKKSLRHYVYCPLHQKTEEVKTVAPWQIVSVEGCVFGGLTGFGVFP
ncbi:MAG: hypothetical protein IJ521_05170, partial [Schwartzia sp.]|nr:hypothetical protein [Schwartzia sp. (in: firmicutes)]